jgi:hypothetical protein
MYRNDDDAARYRADAATAEAERLRQENERMRMAMQAPPTMPMYHALPTDTVYKMDVRGMPLQERARIAQHTLRPFPVIATVLLNFISFGLFGLIHFGMMHDRMPRAADNDPSSGKAIGYQFIPYYNLYWVFFNSLRLCDRLTLQFRLRAQQDHAPRGLMMATCVCSVIPYVNILALLFLWPITAGVLQASVNRAAQLPPQAWDSTHY